MTGGEVEPVKKACGTKGCGPALNKSNIIIIIIVHFFMINEFSSCFCAYASISAIADATTGCFYLTEHGRVTKLKTPFAHANTREETVLSGVFQVLETRKTVSCTAGPCGAAMSYVVFAVSTTQTSLQTVFDRHRFA